MPRSRIVGVLRFLRSVAPLPRRRRQLGRVPRPQPPTLVQMEYFKALRHVPQACARGLASVRGELLELVAAEREAEAAAAAGARRDAPGSERERKAKALVHKAAAAIAAELQPSALHAVAAQFGKRTTEHARAQLDRQVRAAIGVSLSDVEPHTRDMIPMWARSNVELIKTVPSRFFDRLSDRVQGAFESGMHPRTLAKQLDELPDMAASDTLRIARDQIGKLNAAFTQERHEALGVTGYTWRGALDNRERDEHTDREGEHFEYDDPPEGGNPGEDIQCRCWAEPDFGPLLDAID